MARHKAPCWACPDNKKQPQPVDGHHVVPVEYGGEESGKKVEICASCHDLIHSAAEEFVSTGVLPPVLTPNQLILVKYIARAKTAFLAEGKERSDTARNQTTIRFSNEEHALLHTMKNNRGFKSVERYIKYLIFEDFKRHRK